jgi:Right handed beta helix region
MTEPRDHSPNRRLFLRGLAGTAAAAAVLAAPDRASAATTGPATYAEVDSFGAVGDGNADDTGAIQAAINTGQRVVLTGGKTYKTSSTLWMTHAGQVFDGNGAKIKRANQSGTTQWVSLGVQASDCRVRDLEIDGNKANYTTADWENTSEIVVLGDRTVVERCYLHDFPGEGIQHGLGDHVVISECTLLNGNGNAIHFGSAGPVWQGGRVVFCMVKNVNLDTSVGHADGCITISNGIGDFLVHGNYLENGLAGVGSVDSRDNSNFTISCNEIRGMTRYAIDGDNNTNGNTADNVLIEGNRFYSNPPLIVAAYNSSSTQPTRWSIIGNLLTDTQIYIANVSQCVVTGNTISYSDNTTPAINVNGGAVRTSISRNAITGGDSGIRLVSSNYSVDISDNTLHGQRSFGILDLGSGVRSIGGNQITNDSGAGGGYQAIQAGGGATVSGNRITLSSGVRAIYGQSGSKGVITGNVCKGATTSIRVNTGTTGWVVKDNVVDVAIGNQPGNAQVLGNVVL